jgi:hypothetical protein
MPEETLNGPLPNDPPQTEPQDPDEVVIGERDDL